MLSIDVKKYLQGVSVSENYDTNFDTLSVFSSELERLNISDCIYRILLSYSNINSLVGNIVDSKYELILDKGVSSLSNNKVFCNLINAYCVINNSFYDIIESNDYYRFIDNIGILSSSDEKLLFELLNSGDEQIKKKIKNIIVVCNLRFVRSFAYKYSLKNSKFPFDELMEEGNIGLLRAINSFDFSKGNKFSTYAHQAVKQRIVSYCNRGTSQISLSYDFSEKMIVYIKIKKDYIKTYGKNPSVDYMKKQFRLMWRNKISEKSLNELFYLIEQCSMDVLSLSMPIVSNGDYYLEDIVPDDSTAFYEELESNDLPLLFKKVFEEVKLNDRERMIINYRYGLDGYPILTLDQIRTIFGITYQRVQQIDKNVLKKIKKNEKCRYILSGYYK